MTESIVRVTRAGEASYERIFLDVRRMSCV